MATYTIKIQNNAQSQKTYVVFQAPAPGPAVLAGWSVRQTIAAGGSAEVGFTPPPARTPSLLGRLCALLFRAPPSPPADQFRLAVDADAPKAGPHIDFSASPSAATTIVHGLDGALSVAAVSALGYSSFVTPVEVLPPEISGNDFVAPYAVTATFTNSAGGGCANGEYRQQVKGQFRADGSIVSHQLCGSTLMSLDVFQEDGCPPETCTAFGYRACPPLPWIHSTYSNPDQALGADYAMSSQIGFFNIQPDAYYAIDLQIQASLVDTAAGVTLVARTWSVVGQVLTPRAASMDVIDKAEGLQPSDRLAAVRLSRNLASGGPEVHVVVARAPGSPRLDPNAVKVTLVDAGGQPVAAAEPVAHEVGGKRGTTASIIHRLLPDQAAPVKATLDIDGRVTEMAIVAA